MKHWLIFSVLLFIVPSIIDAASSVRRNNEILVDKYMVQFNQRLKQWQSTLPTVQKEEFEDLFEYYSRVYAQYQQNPQNQKIALQMHEVKQLFENIIQSWNSSQKLDDANTFNVKEYSEIKIFNDSFKKWKSILSTSQQKKYNKVIVHYQHCFDVYDNDPKDTSKKKNVLNAQKQIKKRMDVA